MGLKSGCIRFLVVLLILMVDSRQALADCFGSPSWSTIGASGVCLTTDETEWYRVSNDPSIVSFDPSGSGVPVTVGGLPVSTNVRLALISEIVLTRIGTADYLGDGILAPTPTDRRLRAGAITEIFQGTPEVPPGSIWMPRFPSILDLESDPTNGFLSLGVEPGSTINIDFDEPAQRPRSWGATLSGVGTGNIALNVVLGHSSPVGGTDPAADTIFAIPVQDGFIGLATPGATNLARVQFVLAAVSPGRSFRVDDVAYASTVVPEPSTALFLGMGLSALAGRRPKVGFLGH